MHGNDLPLVVSGLIFIFGVAAAILAFFTPFFIFRIRNEMIELNKNVLRLIATVKGEDGASDTNENPIIICPHCGQRNRKNEGVCLRCSKPMFE